jgi:DNA-binding MurR/RpiR family transcriptional regulator
LIEAITLRHDSLGRRAQDIARFVIQNPNDIALSSSKTLAAMIGVQSSNLVRFAQGFGYAGFSEMQRVFQSRLVAEAPGQAERMDALRAEMRSGLQTPSVPDANASGDSALLSQSSAESSGRSADAIGPLQRIVYDLAAHDMAAIQESTNAVSEQTLGVAADTLARARTIFIAGQLRAFPVAAYLHYAMLHLRRPVHLISVGGGLASEIAQLSGPEDVLIAVSFRFYAREVVDLVEERARHKVPVIAITDSSLSPLTKHAVASLIVPAGEHNFAASLAAPMCAAQALVMTMAERLSLDLDNRGTRNTR